MKQLKCLWPEKEEIRLFKQGRTPSVWECFPTKQKALTRGCTRQMQDELNFTADFSLHEKNLCPVFAVFHTSSEHSDLTNEVSSKRGACTLPSPLWSSAFISSGFQSCAAKQGWTLARGVPQEGCKWLNLNVREGKHFTWAIFKG